MIGNTTKIKFRPDIILTWPKNCDYPVWRYFVKSHRNRFNKIIIAFMEPNSGIDYSEFIKEAMKNDNITFINAPAPKVDEDWRNLAVNASLKESKSRWVFFTEQDFMPTGFGFWAVVYEAIKKFDLVGITQGGRLHPACIFVKRSVVDRTRKDFGIDFGKGDHFSKFQKDIEKMDIKRVYLADEKTYQYYHFNGLSQNWRLITEEQQPNYEPNNFYDYLDYCLELGNLKLVPLHEEFERVAKLALSRKIIT